MTLRLILLLFTIRYIISKIYFKFMQIIIKKRIRLKVVKYDTISTDLWPRVSGRQVIHILCSSKEMEIFSLK